MSGERTERVFISYSHDSPEHEKRVLDLAGQLRREGVDAWIDRYEPHPAEGWPRWMQRQIVYPEGAVDHLLAETHGHPYLIQLVCDELYRRLNERQRLHADPDDMQAAIDAAFGKTSLFYELWRQHNEPEQTWLRTLATEPRSIDRPDEPLRGLTRTHFVELVDGNHQVAVPMFAAWIRDQKGS